MLETAVQPRSPSLKGIEHTRYLELYTGFAMNTSNLAVKKRPGPTREPGQCMIQVMPIINSSLFGDEELNGLVRRNRVR